MAGVPISATLIGHEAVAQKPSKPDIIPQDSMPELRDVAYGSTMQPLHSRLQHNNGIVGLEWARATLCMIVQFLMAIVIVMFASTP